jgi:hypothetical protein
VRFFIDNNLSPHLARALRALALPDGVDVQHLADKFPRDTPDATWIGALAKETEPWCIITQDRLTRSPFEKEALRQSGLTTFVLAKGWAHLSEWDKAWMLIRWWPRIMQQAGLVTGGAVFEVPVRFRGAGQFQQIRI